jgi:hypothetical protein
VSYGESDDEGEKTWRGGEGTGMDKATHMRRLVRKKECSILNLVDDDVTGRYINIYEKLRNKDSGSGNCKKGTDEE